LRQESGHRCKKLKLSHDIQEESRGRNQKAEDRNRSYDKVERRETEAWIKEKKGKKLKLG
jgi:hypothetical protein